jgi:ribosomal protein S18 acetylase RimI-like enzyme
VEQIYRYAPAKTAEREAQMQFAINFRLPDFKRILVNRDFHPFLVRDRESGQVVALSNWKVTAPAKTVAGLAVESTDYRALSKNEKLWSWLYWGRDKLSKVLPNWLYSIFQPRNHGFYERKSRWFVKVLNNFSSSVLQSDKELGYWTLMHLGVSPHYGGQGIASALLQWGLNKADNDIRAIYIIATTAGAKLYRKHGFEVVSSDTYFPGEPYGGFEVLIMRRGRRSEREKTTC